MMPTYKILVYTKQAHRAVRGLSFYYRNRMTIMKPIQILYNMIQELIQKSYNMYAFDHYLSSYKIEKKESR